MQIVPNAINHFWIPAEVPAVPTVWYAWEYLCEQMHIGGDHDWWIDGWSHEAILETESLPLKTIQFPSIKCALRK